MTGFHLAQVNVARLAAPLDSPQLVDFVSNLLWRLQTEAGDATALRIRQEWFKRLLEHHLALWWIEPGTLPTLGDAIERLLTLRAEGPTEHAFTLKEPYPLRRQAPTP